MVLGWPSMCGKPSSSYLSFTTGESKAQAAAGRKFYSGKGVGKEEKEKGGGRAGMTKTSAASLYKPTTKSPHL